MKKRQIILATLLLLLVLITIRMLWLNQYFRTDFQHAEKGILDLRGHTWTEKSIPLDGEWYFDPGELTDPNSSFTSNEWRIIPDSWNKEKNNQYGTYRLRILLDDRNNQSLKLRFEKIETSAEVFINGEQVGSNGRVSTVEEGAIPDSSPFMINVPDGLNEIDLIIHVSNYETHIKGGIIRPVHLGTDAAILKEQGLAYSLEIMGFVVLLLHSVYLLIAYFLFYRKKEILYFVACLSAMSIATITDNSRILLSVFPSITYGWWIKIFFMSYTTTFLFFVQFCKHFFSQFQRKSYMNWYIMLCIFFLFYILCMPYQYVANSWAMLGIVLLIPSVAIPVLIYKAILSGKGDMIYLFLGIISIGSSIVWGILKNIKWLDFPFFPYYPFDLVIGVIFFTTYWIKQFIRLYEDSRQMTEKLQIIDKRRDDFLANTSHELRNPLNGIINMAEEVLEKERAHIRKESAVNLKLLIKIGHRMSHLLNDLLDTTRLKEGKIRLEISDVNMSSIVLAVFDMLHFMREGKNVEFVLDFPSDFPNVRGDENRLIQILFNLLHNALKFSDGGQITVSGETKDGMVIIHVKDEGIGMGAESLKTIFEPYEQGDSNMKMMGGGIGLGLSVCKQLVELHGGEISVDSSVNTGTTFTVSIPTAENSPEQASILGEYEEDKDSKESFQNIEVKIGGSFRILIVDDDPINLRIFDQILQAQGYETVTCLSGNEALKELNKKQFDLVISDVMMPNMSGFELTKKIRDRYMISELPVLLLTARFQPEDIQSGFLAGANDYVLKPVEKLEFLSRVRALTAIKHSINERVRIEAAWLQAQIQPHFLFNTINTIAALTEVNPRKTAELLVAFGHYLKASFNPQNLEKTVPLKDELELIRSYLYIEQQRFSSRLQVKMEIDEKAEIEVPPLSIQTIVENAVQHGVLKKTEGGTVTIQMKEQEDAIIFNILDDGVGMTNKQLESILNDRIRDQRGIGLVNTDKRLKQLYGKGLQITSVLGEGTVVSFSIPK